MADKDLHLANATIRESGTDQLHIASSIGVFRFATFTENNAVRAASVSTFAVLEDKDLHVANTTIRESGTDQLHIASSVGVFRFATFTEHNAARAMSESTLAVRAWQVLDITSDEYDRAVLTLVFRKGTRQVTVSNLTVEQATEKINRSEYHGNEILAR